MGAVRDISLVAIFASNLASQIFVVFEIRHIRFFCFKNFSENLNFFFQVLNYPSLYLGAVGTLQRVALMKSLIF